MADGPAPFPALFDPAVDDGSVVVGIVFLHRFSGFVIRDIRRQIIQENAVQGKDVEDTDEDKDGNKDPV